MKRAYLIIACVLVITGCGRWNSNSWLNVLVDPELEPYALEFEATMGIDISHVSMAFQDLAGRQMGVCASWSNGKRDVMIDRDQWLTLSEIAREQLIYHELGHCTMNLKHDDATVVDPHTGYAIQASVMNSYFFGESYNWNRYAADYKKAQRLGQRLEFEASTINP